MYIITCRPKWRTTITTTTTTATTTTTTTSAATTTTTTTSNSNSNNNNNIDDNKKATLHKEIHSKNRDVLQSSGHKTRPIFKSSKAQQSPSQRCKTTIMITTIVMVYWRSMNYHFELPCSKDTGAG